jgi:hypothetical protein
MLVGRTDDGSNDYQRQPAASVMAIDARSAMARVKRARFAFTISVPHRNGCEASIRQPGGLEPGGRRSLALRPRLTTGLPWTDGERGTVFVPVRKP